MIISVVCICFVDYEKAFHRIKLFCNIHFKNILSLNFHKSTCLGCKRSREFVTSRSDSQASPSKKPRMVFTEIQRRTLVAIFKEIKRPSKEIQATIAEQLGLKVSTVVNFFMNARRRSVDKYVDDATEKDLVSNSVSSTGSSLEDMTTGHH